MLEAVHYQEEKSSPRPWIDTWPSKRESVMLQAGLSTVFPTYTAHSVYCSAAARQDCKVHSLLEPRLQGRHVCVQQV